MTGYVTGADRSQTTLFPDRLEDFVGADNPVRAVDAFVDGAGSAGHGLRACGTRGDRSARV